jgi:branched-chain amino acid transport system ATP-binding protein
MTRTFQIVKPFAAQTVRENIAVGAHLHVRGRAEALQNAEAVALRVGLAPQLDKPASDLTVAGRKRLGLARALATKPRLLLLDEISEGLAPVIVQKLAEMILTLKAKGYTIVLVEQNFRFAAPLADRFYVMEHGRIVKQFAQSDLAGNMGMLQEYLGV